jgi:hypothetical protein
VSIAKIEKSCYSPKRGVVMQNIRSFVELTDQAILIRDSEASWETKYDLIFSDQISVAIRNTGVSFSYYDPDSSYEEDVRVFVSSVADKALELKKVLGALDSKEDKVLVDT